jgi:hypothetical protein
MSEIALSPAVERPGELTEDWSSVLVGPFVFVMALVATFFALLPAPSLVVWASGGDARRFALAFTIVFAIVILGGFIAATAVGKLTLASLVLPRGVAAIVETDLIYWAVVHCVARKYFGFTRECAAPQASGISIRGVAASISAGDAIRARPQAAVLVSSLVVIFAGVKPSLAG